MSIDVPLSNDTEKMSVHIRLHAPNQSFDPVPNSTLITRNKTPIPRDTLTSLNNGPTAQKKDPSPNDVLRELFDGLLDGADAMVEQQYHPELVKLLQRCKRPVSNLPILELGNRNLKSLKPKDMPHPIMGFNHNGQVGIAIHIRGKAEIEVCPFPYSDTIWVPDLANVLILFKDNFSDNDGLWSHAWGNDGDDTIERIDEEMHKKTKEDYRGLRIVRYILDIGNAPVNSLFYDVLTRRGKTFTLGSNTPRSFLGELVNFLKKRYTNLFSS